MFKGPMAAAHQRRGSNDGSSDWTDDRAAKVGSRISAADSGKASRSRLELGGRHHRNTIAVGDVDGRAFDILLRYLYNERIQLQSVMTALTTLYAAHKYMCPGLAKQVVAYLKENLTEKNVLLVLQHICLYCSGSSENNFDNAASSDNTYWTVPVTAQPPGQQQQQQQQQQLLQLRNRNSETDKQVFQPSAPPADQEEEEEEEDPLLCSEDDLKDFSAGMSVTTSAGSGNGKVKVNCCNALLKQCLELIDLQAGGVLSSEDIEDLDISAINMIVCRDTLNISRESEVFNALHRWSTREVKRQRMELTPENRRTVLEGSQYLVRYLVMSQEEFTKGPYRSGLLTKEEEESILSIICGASVAFGGCSLPDHLTGCETLMRTRRRGQNPPHGINISRFSRSGRRLSKKRTGKRKKDTVGCASTSGSASTSGLMTSHVTTNGVALNSAAVAAAANGQKDKFNIIEEFFVCLACIFD